MEKTLWELAFGRLAWVVFTEMKGKWVVPTFPISLHRREDSYKQRNLRFESNKKQWTLDLTIF